MTGDPGRQLILDLPHRTGQGPDDFLVAGSNQRAAVLIESWPDWPWHCAVLVGPSGSGKSHLVEIWRQASGARVISAAQIRHGDVFALADSGALAIEDLPGPILDERGLFHLLNLARERRGHLLLSARTMPASWTLTLPDLISRLNAAPLVEIGAPDDALLRAVLVKLFADRQIGVDEPIVGYLLSRMPRSFEAARSLVAELDRRALERKAEVTRSFAARVLADMFAPGIFAAGDSDEG